MLPLCRWRGQAKLRLSAILQQQLRSWWDSQLRQSYFAATFTNCSPTSQQGNCLQLSGWAAHTEGYRSGLWLLK